MVDDPSTDPLPHPRADPLVGRLLCGRFRVRQAVARGGMGCIYRATQEPLGRDVALKVLRVDQQDERFRKRFFLEASACARLSHPNTVRIFDYGTSEDGVFFIAMEFLDGETLQRRLNRTGAMEPLAAVRLLRQICGALAEAHGQGIIHRDLKPDNVILTQGAEGDFPKVVDFGLVKELGVESELSRTGTVIGSPLYMAPEQISAQALDQRTDVYALGLIAFRALTGHTPFRRGEPLAVMMQQATARPPAFRDMAPGLEVPAALEWLVQQCLEKKPEGRPGSMEQLLKGLRACERELRGELEGPLVLRLKAGEVLLPPGVVVELEPSVSLTAPGPADADPTIASGLRTQPTGIRSAALVLAGTSAAGGVALLVVGLLAGAMGLGWWYSSRGAVQQEPVAAETEELPAPAAPELTPVRVDSVPSGAQVEREGVYLGATPLQLSLPAGKAWIVDLTLEGYEPRSVRLAADAADLVVPLVTAPRSEPRPEPRSTKVSPRPAVPPPAPVTKPQPEPEAPPAAEPAPAPKPRYGSDLRDPWGQ